MEMIEGETVERIACALESIAVSLNKIRQSFDDFSEMTNEGVLTHKKAIAIWHANPSSD